MCKGLAALPHTCLERAKEIKTKLGTLLQKPETAIDLIIPYPEKLEKPIKAPKPSTEEAFQWRESLEKLVQNSYGLSVFQNFLKSEFSEENIEFWMACEEYRKVKSPTKLATKAKKIYEEFIQTEAPREALRPLTHLMNKVSRTDDSTKDLSPRLEPGANESALPIAVLRYRNLSATCTPVRSSRSPHSGSFWNLVGLLQSLSER
uniref:Regulator of G protein signaling 5 n=1 Tax=Leptobrachium leishanense TaxID=445787 RepID=A0A8C5PUK4_9ANUR